MRLDHEAPPPPGLDALFATPPPTDADAERAAALMRWYAEQSARLEAEARAQMIAWTPVFCTCRPRYSPRRPSSAKCVIHAGFMITPDGRVL
jgi:hypothetical protein